MQETALLRIPPSESASRDDATKSASTLRAGKRIVLLQTQAEGAGAQEITRILGGGLDARGYDVHSVFFYRRTAAYDDHPNTFFCARERPTSIRSVLAMLVRLVRHLQDLKPDAVLCFQHYGIVIGTPAAWLSGARTVIANQTTATSLTPRAVRWLDFIFGRTGLFARNVVNSAALEQEYQHYPAGYRARIVRIDHGFEPKTTTLTRQDARRSFRLPDDVTVLGSVARLHPAKNLGAAIRLLPGRDWHLALAGQGAARGDLVDLATSLGVIDRVHFVGEQPAARIGAFLRSLDVFVFPSYAETFGLAGVEAAQAGIPVVANDLAVLRETLAADGRPCALFVDVDDTEAFATAVRRILEDDDLRAALSAQGAQLSRAYSLDAMVQRYADLIEAVTR
jgi:glycosyltransferase involved in cell wall biosynthesis